MRIVGFVYLVGVVTTFLTLVGVFYWDREESGIPMIVAAPLAAIGGLGWPVMVWMLLDEWLGFPFAPPTPGEKERHDE